LFGRDALITSLSLLPARPMSREPLRAAGRDAEAERLRTGVLDALERLGDAPELYAVGPDGPRAVAISNRVQAWTVRACWALAAERDGRVPALLA
jgi:hypothetical protein